MVLAKWTHYGLATVSYRIYFYNFSSHIRNKYLYKTNCKFSKIKKPSMFCINHYQYPHQKAIEPL